MFTTENKPKSTGIASQFLWIFAYFLGVASAPTVYPFLKNGTEVFLTFVPPSFLTFPKSLTFGHRLFERL